MTEKIEGKVAQILTARDLVINKGTDDGVEVGMRFAVLNRRGADILDPDSGEVLGSVELAKTFVKVITAQPRLSIGRTFRTFTTPGRRSLTGIEAWAALSESIPASTRVETLKTDEKRLQEELDPSESYVKIGDPVVQMRGDEFAGAAIDE